MAHAMRESRNVQLALSASKLEDHAILDFCNHVPLSLHMFAFYLSQNLAVCLRESPLKLYSGKNVVFADQFSPFLVNEY